MRRRLVEAAVEQLADDGLRALTHRRVEQRAGVSQGLVKHHFGTLDGLIEAVVEHLADVELGAVMTVTPEQRAVGFATGVVPPEVWAAARASWQAVTSRPGLVRARFELYLHASRRPELARMLSEGRERFIEAVAASLPGPDPRAAAQMVLALTNGLLLHWLSGSETEIDELAPAALLAVGAVGLLPGFGVSPPDP